MFRGTGLERSQKEGRVFPSAGVLRGLAFCVGIFGEGAGGLEKVDRKRIEL